VLPEKLKPHNSGNFMTMPAPEFEELARKFLFEIFSD
jgi:hypothetical protein